MNRFTICKECKYLINEGDGWYNNFCGAVRNEKVKDPFDGSPKWGLVNDLGRLIITNHKHPYVREINTCGQCKHFEEKPDMEGM
jgi:hypothetical protein